MIEFVLCLLAISFKADREVILIWISLLKITNDGSIIEVKNRKGARVECFG